MIKKIILILLMPLSLMAQHVQKLNYDTVSVSKGLFNLHNTIDAYTAEMQRSSTTNGLLIRNQVLGQAGPGNALKFTSASSQQFQFSDASLPTGNITATFTAWVQRTGTNAVVFSYGTNASTQLLLIYVNATQVVFYNGAGNASYNTSAFTLNTWHHLMFTFAAGSLKCYVDGSLINTLSGTQNITKSGTGLASNYSALVGYPDCILDQYAIYSGTALTATDATNLYNGGNGTATMPGSPTIRFDMDDGAPSTTLLNTGTASSSNGTTFNSPTWVGIGNGKVPTAGSSMPVWAQILKSSNGVGASSSTAITIGENQAEVNVQALRHSFVSSDGSNGLAISSAGVLIDQSNTSLVPTIDAQLKLGAGLTTPGGGQLKFITSPLQTTKESGVMTYDGTSWYGANSALTEKKFAWNPMTTTGDITYSVGAVETRLPIGTSNTVLTVSGGVPAWLTNLSAERGSVVSSAGTLTLAYGNDYSFSGTTSIWTLPAISSLIKSGYYQITIKNRGTGNITVNSNAGGNDIYDTAAVNTILVLPGGAVTLLPDGTYITRQ